MWRNRVLYLLTLLAVTVFFGFFYAWFSEFLWLLTLALPLLSLAVSLPAMLLVKPRLEAPGVVPRGQSASITVTTRCSLPQPHCRFRLEGQGNLDSQVFGGKAGKKEGQLTRDLPTQHCGSLVCRTRRVWVSDYLGLISIPRFWKEQAKITVVPQAAVPNRLPSINQLLSTSSRPKPGGGYAERYELRDYRPGDSLRQIHWKLTAKSNEPIVREPQEPDRGAVVLSLDISGTPDEIDRILEKTLFLSGWLLRQELHHEVRWVNALGNVAHPMTDTDQLPGLALALAESSPTPAGLTSNVTLRDASWHYHVLPDA